MKEDPFQRSSRRPTANVSSLRRQSWNPGKNGNQELLTAGPQTGGEQDPDLVVVVPVTAGQPMEDEGLALARLLTGYAEQGKVVGPGHELETKSRSRSPH